MADTHMMTSKTYDIKKIKYPCFLSEKLDGVPGIYTVEEDGISVISRKGKTIFSTKHIVEKLKLFHFPVGTKIIGEHYINGLKFNEINGKVRDTKKQYPELILHVFDIITKDDTNTYTERYNRILTYLNKGMKFYLENIADTVLFIPIIEVNDINQLEAARKSIINTATINRRKIEGIMYRNHDGVYEYTRSWGCMKEVFKSYTDLKVVEVLEALDKNKNYKGMVGTIICEDAKGTRFNVGPGKSTHTERKRWWEKPDTIVGKIIVVQHKPDENYVGLREPTYQHIHEDKTEPDEVVNE